MGNQQQHGRREAPNGGLGFWWSQHLAWVAGLDRSQRIRYRLFQTLVVISALIVGASLYLRSWIRLPEVPDPPLRPVVNNAGDSSGSQSGSDVMYEGAELPDVVRSGRKEGYYTFLLCGQDAVSGATDTMILFTYDTKEQKINAISLMRDTMINTAANSKRLNAVYARNRGDRSLSQKERVENGMAALRQEVSRLTGIYPDFYVLVQWEAIGELVEAVGGVEFEVPFDMDYDDPEQNLHIHQKAGLRLLSGEDAMEVIRFRKNNDETIVLYDSGRTQIQRDFLTAALKKCLTPEILLKLPTLAQIFTEQVDTDLTVGNILAFAQLAAGMDTQNDLNFVSMPFENAAYRGASMVVTHQDELLELLNNGFNPYTDEIRASDLQLIYKKSGGGYGVTNAELADPAMGRSATATQPASADGAGEDGGPEPGGIADIDPDDIFPDPDPDDQSGEHTEQRPQAAA